MAYINISTSKAALTFAFAAFTPTIFGQPPATAAAPALAPAAPTPVPATTAASELPEVQVLGRALLRPQEKPVSATFLSQDAIDQLRIQEPQDIARVTPNMFATDSGSRSFGDVYSTRGLANTVFFGAPATTIYVDDVPFGETFTYAQKLSAVNSVEVLRGAQPGLVGRNTYGGLINIRSRKPGDIWEGAVNGTHGSFDRYETDGWVMGPLVKDALHIRLGGAYDEREGYLKNPLTGERVDDQQHWNLNGGLFWNPAPGWEISLTASVDEWKDGAPRLTSLDRKAGFYEVESNVAGSQERKSDNEALRVSYEGDNFKFLSVTSRRAWNLNPYIADIDFSPEPLGSINLTQDQEFWSQEFRFGSSNEKSPWQWTAGAYGSMGEINGDSVRHIFTQRTDITNTDITSRIPIPLPQKIILTSTSDSDLNISQRTRHKIEEEAVALFTGVSYSGWKPLTFHAGLRMDWVKRELDRDKTTDIDALTHTRFAPLPTLQIPTPYPGIFFPYALPTPEPLVTTTKTHTKDQHQHFSDDWLHFTPSLGLDYDITPDVLAYAKSTYAFKPGGFSAYADDARYTPFKDEKSWQSEIGLKTQWLDKKLTANVSGFWNEIEDYQVERSFTQTDYAVFNANRTRAYGFDVESQWDIDPMLTLQGNVGYTHARFLDYKDPVTGKNLDGKTPPFVPEFDAALSAEFHTHGFFVRAEYQWLGDTWFDDFNRPDFQQDSYGILNAAIGYRSHYWNIMVYATNLTKEEYYTNMNTDVRTGAPGAPQEFGVKLGLTF